MSAVSLGESRVDECCAIADEAEIKIVAMDIKVSGLRLITVESFCRILVSVAAPKVYQPGFDRGKQLLIKVSNCVIVMRLWGCHVSVSSNQLRRQAPILS